MVEGKAFSAEEWKNMKKSEKDFALCSPLTITRIKNDIKTAIEDPLPSIFVIPDEDNIFEVHAVILGSEDTPYEGGFFHFLFNFPDVYPIKPPTVKCLTSLKSSLRFNPNIYCSGKVCLSIIGTWSGPQWSPAQSLSSVLLSIQSLMNNKPYFNEPGFSKERFPGESQKYNESIAYETLRVALLDTIQYNVTGLPLTLHTTLKILVEDNLKYYKSLIERYVHLNGESLFSPYTSFGLKVKPTLDFNLIKSRVEELKST